MRAGVFSAARGEVVPAGSVAVCIALLTNSAEQRRGTKTLSRKQRDVAAARSYAAIPELDTARHQVGFRFAPAVLQKSTD